MIVDYDEASTWADIVYTNAMAKDWLQTFRFREKKKHLEFCMEEMFKREEMFEK